MSTNNSAGTIAVQVTVQGIEQLKSQLLGTSQAFKGFGSGVSGADAATKGFESSSQRLKSSVQGTSLNLRSMASDLDSSTGSTKATATSMSQLASTTSKAKDSVMQTGQAAEETGGKFGRLSGFTRDWGDVLTSTISSASGILVFSTMMTAAIEEQAGMQEMYNQQVAKAEKLQEAYNQAVAKYGEGSKEAVKAADKYNDALDGLAYTERNLRFATGDVTTMAVMFGTSSMGLATGAIPATIKAIQKVRAAKQGMSAAAEVAADALDTVDISARKSSKSLGDIGKNAKIKPVVTDLRAVDINMTKMSKSADNAAKSSKGLANSMRFSGALSSLNSVSVGMDGIEKSSGKAATGIRAVGGAMRTALIASGIGIAIAGGVALLQAFAHNWWGLRDAVNAAGKAIGDTLGFLKGPLEWLGGVGNEIAKFFGGEVPEAMAQTDDSLKKIEVTATETGDSFEYVEDLAKQAAESMATHIENVRDRINQAFEEVHSADEGIFQSMADALREGSDEFDDAFDEFEDKIKINFTKSFENMIEDGAEEANIADNAKQALGLVVKALDIAESPGDIATLRENGKKVIEYLDEEMDDMGPQAQIHAMAAKKEIENALNNPYDLGKFKTHMANAGTHLDMIGESAAKQETPLKKLDGKISETGEIYGTMGSNASTAAGGIGQVGTAAGTTTNNLGGLVKPLGLTEVNLAKIAKSNAPSTLQTFGIRAGSAKDTAGQLVGTSGTNGPLPLVASTLIDIEGTDAAGPIKAAGTAASNAKTPFDNFAQSVANGYNALSKWASDAAKGAFDSITKFFSGDQNKPSDFSQGLIDKYNKQNQTPVTPAPGYHQQSFNKGGGGGQLGSELSGLKLLAQAASLAVQKEISAMVVAVQGMVKMMADSARASFVQIGTDIVGLSKGIMAFSQGVGKVIPQVGTHFQTMANSARTAMVQVGQDIVGLSRGVIAFSTGIAQTATKIWQSFTTMANGARSGMVQMGQDIICLSKGIVAFRDGVAQTASRVASSIRSMASSFGSSMSQLISRANAAASAVKSLKSSIDSLRSKSITITVTTRYRTVGTPTKYSAGSVSASSLEMPAQQAGFGLASASGTNNNSTGSGSQQLVLPQRMVIEATIHNHVELEGREIVKYVNKHLLENYSVTGLT